MELKLGGVALFYFCVFSAYQFHQLIGGLTRGAGLVACAIACLTLAGRETLLQPEHRHPRGPGRLPDPMLVDAMDLGTPFILAYIACINIPVMILGLRRRWQPLYNLCPMSTRSCHPN